MICPWQESVPPMTLKEPRTSGTLLRRAQKTDDQAAWTELFDRYQPMLKRWTRAQLGSRVDSDEISQRIWCELVDRLPNFSYDSKRSFRAWLRSLHRSRLLDYLKQQRRYRSHLQSLADESSEPILPNPHGHLVTTSGPLDPQREDPTQSSIVRMLEIQKRVQARVSPKTWELYDQVTIQNESIGDVARKHSMRYASVFAAVSRVNKMLRQEASL
jgi:RNA polymerase sigma-70 factor (ECF subfamily)